MKKNILIIGNSHPSSIEKMFYHSFRKLEIKVQFLILIFILGCIKKIKYILNSLKIITLIIMKLFMKI